MTSAAPLQFLILLVASWIGRRQGEAIEYLRAELVLSGPHGTRIEGLSLDDAAALLRRL